MSGQRLVHVALADDWEACKRFGEYDVSTRGTTFDTAGFIHATTAMSLTTVLNDVYDDVSLPLLLVVIDEDALSEVGIEIQWEVPATARQDGELVPRILGQLPMDSQTVVAELPIDRRDGEWLTPDLTNLSVRTTHPAQHPAP